jgi:outer membrane protein W
MFWSLLAISSTLSAQGSGRELTPTPPCSFSQPVFEVKTGYFFFSNSKMRRVYDQGGWDVQLSSSFPVGAPSKRLSLHAYAALEYMNYAGRSLEENQKTTLWEIPVTLGLKSVILLGSQRHYYFTLGPRYFYIHQHNQSLSVDREKSRNGLGFFANTGFNFKLGRHFFIDIFGEYSYAKIRFHTHKCNVYTRKIQVGGFTVGGGIGYTF